MSNRCVAVFILIVVAATLCLAQQSGSIADPEAERILDNAARAEGRTDALNTLKTLRVKGGVYSGPSFRTSDFESVAALPEKFCDTFTTSDGHTLKYGYDGSQAWAQSAPGEGLTRLPRIQLMLPAAQWRLRYTKAQFVGQRRIGKRDTYVIRASVRGQNAAADYYYDAVTFLLLRVDAVSEPNPAPITYTVSDYKDVSGLNIPRDWDFGGSSAVVESIKVNVPISDKQFARPK